MTNLDRAKYLAHKALKEAGYRQVSDTAWQSPNGERFRVRISGEHDRSGSGHWATGMNDDKVRELRELRANGWTQTDLAAKFDISQPAVSDILTGKTWKHVD